MQRMATNKGGAGRVEVIIHPRLECTAPNNSDIIGNALLSVQWELVLRAVRYGSSFPPETFPGAGRAGQKLFSHFSAIFKVFTHMMARKT